VYYRRVAVSNLF